jgi:hypothetical protein
MTMSLRIVGEIQYHFAPAHAWNPWLGYGIGIETSAVSVSSGSGNDSSNASATGFDFAHLMAGIDYRQGRGFGVGPFVDFSLGQYESVNYDLPGQSSQTMGGKALHAWLAFGARFVIKP